MDVGKPGCEAHYRAHWKTVDRWVEECGKVELRAARAEEVARRRDAKRKPDKPQGIDLGPKVDKDDLHAACHYLRDKTTLVGIRANGRYFVGRQDMTGAEVLQLALARGMDEWYIERDIMARLDLECVDEFVLDRELML